MSKNIKPIELSKLAKYCFARNLKSALCTNIENNRATLIKATHEANNRKMVLLESHGKLVGSIVSNEMAEQYINAYIKHESELPFTTREEYFNYCYPHYRKPIEIDNIDKLNEYSDQLENQFLILKITDTKAPCHIFDLGITLFNMKTNSSGEACFKQDPTEYFTAALKNITIAPK